MSQPPQPSPQPSSVTITFQQLIDTFHQIYYKLGHDRKGTWQETFWMGVQTEKCPLDMWIYQELLHSIRPQLILETGTRHGGSALFFCHMCDLLGGGEVVTVDVNRPDRPPEHPRLTYLTGSSTDGAIVRQVHDRAAGKSPVLVILDSDHRRNHVLAEMRAYHDLVTPGSYMIVEDSNVNGHPVWPDFGPGPMEAIEDFLRENGDFHIDKVCEKFLLTFNPNGFLRKRG